MKKLTLKFDGMKDMLTKDQMRGVTGGYSSGSNLSFLSSSGGGSGGCCAHTAGWTSSQCGYGSLQEARAAANAAASSSGQRVFYCCAHC